VRAIEDPDADLMPRRDPENVHEVIGARASKPQAIATFARLEKNKIHDLVFIT
jgi:hypothetical protein